MHLARTAILAAAVALSGCAEAHVDRSTTASIHPNAAKVPSPVKTAVFRPQTPKVDMHCFPPRLQAVLADLHREFGRAPVITSGFRPRSGKSQHAHCKAADIRIPGVSPSRIASYARTIPGIGGVGTYRRKSIVHVDVGPRRDWRY